VYRQGLAVHQLNGTEAQAIVIQGPLGEHRAVFQARPGANTVSIIDSSYVVIRNLELDGGRTPVHAVVAEGSSRFAHHITLEGLYIHDHDANQQINGISTKCPAWNWRVAGNVILRTGTGMYFGDSDGGAPFVAGVIEYNVVAGSLGYNLQIKHQMARPHVPGMPERAETLVRHNFFQKSASSSAGKLARPNVLVGHWPHTGPGSEDRYSFYGNVFHENPTEALFQGEGNIAIYSNLFINSAGDALNIRAHNDVPKRIDIFRNTIVAKGVGISVTGADAAFPQRASANAVFASAPVSGVQQSLNHAGTFLDAADYLVAPFAPLGTLDLSPLPDKLAAPAGTQVDDSLPDSAFDFAGRIYARPVFGAYAGQLAEGRLEMRAKARIRSPGL
jgi:hypothetical protein